MIFKQKKVSQLCGYFIISGKLASSEVNSKYYSSPLRWIIINFSVDVVQKRDYIWGKGLIKENTGYYHLIERPNEVLCSLYVFFHNRIFLEISKKRFIQRETFGISLSTQSYTKKKL